MTTQKTPVDKFSFSSSLKADVWHPQKDPKAYEWWYFDALSDDAKESVIIVFLDNFIYSPRYNRSKPSALVDKLHYPPARVSGSDKRFPAVSITYFRDGKPRYHAVNEYREGSFSASEYNPECRIGECSFRFESASYGSGYVVTIDTPLSRNRRLEAHFEWLSIESDFQPEAFCYLDSSHCWNMVAPRSDVTGKITIFDSKGRKSDVRTFRGTGYHDHNLDNRWLAKTVRDWHWGRVHFSDCTAIFYRYCEIDDDSPSTKLFIVRNGELQTRNVDYEEQNYVRDKFGIKYPTRLRLISEDDIRMSVNPIKVIDSSFYYLRFLSEFTLTLSDGKQHQTMGITEFLAPKALKHRWLNWLSDVRTGKNGKGPLL